MPQIPPHASAESTASAHREVTLTRTGPSAYEAVNARGGRIALGSGETDDFTPVELLLAAIAGCSAVDVDLITSRRAEPESFAVTAGGTKLKDEQGNHMGDLEVVFRLRFPDGAQGDQARAALPRAVEQSRDRLCTVSRTVQLGTPVSMTTA